MSKALKVMTFNIQQLPSIARPESDAPWRARAVARAILDLPVREQPDIVAFNEAFSETARPVLLGQLSSKYPHVIKMLEHPGPDVEEDSGLMLFSKLPFLPLAGGDHLFKVFRNTAAKDALAAKGVGVVRVKGPFEITTIAFTHLQASYDAANTEHADVRMNQLAFVRAILQNVAEGDLQNYANSVIVGDLNIKGDPDDTSGERNVVFANTPNSFGADFDDGWRAAMHAPNDLTDHDPGYTQRDTSTFQRNRFDFQCTRRQPNVDIGLIPHHMSTPIRLPSEVSDHWALLGHLHRISPHCTPALAVDLLGFDPINKAQPESSVWMLQTDFADEDMYHWIYISEPGTFSIFTAAALEAAAFRRTDFTHALAPTDVISIAELPPGVQGLVGDRIPVVSKGSVFSWREPFFIRLRGVSTSFLGSAPYVMIRHRGDSPATAFILHPHLTVDPGLPLGQKLGTTDQCFFKAFREDKFTAEPYDDRFELRNKGRAHASLELRDVALASVPGGKVSGADEVLEVTRNGGKEVVFLVLSRDSVNDVHFGVRWVSPLTYVALDESFRLHVDDETGGDWPGDDEYEVDVAIDGDSVFSGTWDNADTGEDWPSLSQAVRNSAQARQGQGKWAAFTSDITYGVLKTDGAFAHGSEVGIIRALDPSDRDVEERMASITVSHPISDGHLTARVSLSRFPPV